MIKRFIPFICCILLLECSKKNSHFENESLLIGKRWLTTKGSKNGVTDPTVPGQESILEFRNDGKMYFDQSNPPIRDTVKYEFLNNTNIKISKPWAGYPVDINYRIDFIDLTHFNFTLTSMQNTDIYTYSTIAQ